VAVKILDAEVKEVDIPVVLKRPLPVETRRRRSGALVPVSGRASTAVVVRPVAKRPRKSKRVLADLRFMASVHRGGSVGGGEASHLREAVEAVGCQAVTVVTEGWWCGGRW